jgi:prepilin-type N-terminal cleavage/methylation domain-containing protein
MPKPASSLLKRVFSFQRGLSLSELMVSLAIVGTVAALTAPSILNNIQEARTVATLKESVSTLTRLFKQGVDNGELYHGMTVADFHAYFANNVNTNAYNTHPTTCPGSWAGWALTGGCFAFPSGAVMTFHNIHVSVGTAAGDGYLDVNGAAPPNVDGKDRMALCYYFGKEDSKDFAAWWGPGLPFQSGEMRPCDNARLAADTALGAANNNYNKL